jgi:hypothetical protein
VGREVAGFGAAATTRQEGKGSCGFLVKMDGAMELNPFAGGVNANTMVCSLVTFNL